MALEALRRIQIGKESTDGTKVAATAKLLGSLTMSPRQEKLTPVDERNSLAEFNRQLILSQGCDLRYEGAISYDQLIVFLSMGLKGGVAGAQVGSSGAYVWTYTPNLTAKNAPDAYTFEYGDDEQEWESGFVVARSLEWSFSMGEAINLTADMFGQFPAKSTFTAGLTDKAVEEIVANTMRVYIDGAWSSLGTTQRTALVTGGTIRLTTGFDPVYYADGSKEFAAIVEKKRHLEIDLDMITGSNFEVEYDAWAADTLRAVSLTTTGSTASGGHPYSFRVDMIGRYTSEPELFGSRDGENTVRLTLSSMDDGTNEMKFVVTNKESALP